MIHEPEATSGASDEHRQEDETPGSCQEVGHVKISGVYGIVHQRTGRVYVGSSCDVFRRWGVHVQALSRGTHHAPALSEVWLRDGPSAFTFVVFEQCPKDVLAQREQEWIDTFEHVLNTTLYAACPALDPEVAKKIGDAKRGQACPAVAESNRRRAGQRWSQPMSAETRAKISASRHERIFGPRAEGVGEKIATALRGRPLSEERKRKISEAHLSRPRTDAQAVHLDRLHALMRTPERRDALRDRMREPGARARHTKNHWSRSLRAAEIGRRISETKRNRTVAPLVTREA